MKLIMGFAVNYAGKEKQFSDLQEAIEFQDNLSCGSDIWDDTQDFPELLRTRMEQSIGSFKVTEYRNNNDH